MREDQGKAKAADCDAYIAKPLRYQALYTAIDALLAAKGGQGVWQTSPGSVQP